MNVLMSPIVINCYIYCTLFPLTYLKWFIIIIDLAREKIGNDLRNSDFRLYYPSSSLLLKLKCWEKTDNL